MSKRVTLLALKGNWESVFDDLRKLVLSGEMWYQDSRGLTPLGSLSECNMIGGRFSDGRSVGWRSVPSRM